LRFTETNTPRSLAAEAKNSISVERKPTERFQKQKKFKDNKTSSRLQAQASIVNGKRVELSKTPSKKKL